MADVIMIDDIEDIEKGKEYKEIYVKRVDVGDKGYTISYTLEQAEGFQKYKFFVKTKQDVDHVVQRLMGL
jgi:hypothetical protein